MPAPHAPRYVAEHDPSRAFRAWSVKDAQTGATLAVYHTWNGAEHAAHVLNCQPYPERPSTGADCARVLDWPSDPHRVLPTADDYRASIDRASASYRGAIEPHELSRATRALIAAAPRSIGRADSDGAAWEMLRAR
jgi:hypothetical protein